MWLVENVELQQRHRLFEARFRMMSESVHTCEQTSVRIHLSEFLMLITNFTKVS